MCTKTHHPTIKVILHPRKSITLHKKDPISNAKNRSHDILQKTHQFKKEGVKLTEITPKRIIHTLFISTKCQTKHDKIFEIFIILSRKLEMESKKCCFRSQEKNGNKRN
jgi:hypothetical protein